MLSSFAFDPSQPSWEEPRSLTTFYSLDVRTGQENNYIPNVTPQAEILDTASRQLAHLCGMSSTTVSDLEAFLTAWRDPSDSARVQPNALAWFMASDALARALEGGYVRLVALLLGLGFVPGEMDMIAALEQLRHTGSKEGLSMLLEDGWDINRAVNKFTTPLMGIIIVDDETLVDWCLSRGALPDAAGPLGFTAMQRAAANCSLETLKLLVGYGGTVANTDLVAHAASGHCSGVTNRLEVIRFLHMHGASLDSYYMEHSSRWNSSDNSLFLSEGRQNALHLAISRRNMDLAAFLIKLGADTSLKMFSLQTEYKHITSEELAVMNGMGELGLRPQY